MILSFNTLLYNGDYTFDIYPRQVITMPSKYKSIKPIDTLTDNHIVTPASLKYLSGYSDKVKQQVQQMIVDNKLERYISTKYPETHEITSDKTLRHYVMSLKNQYLKKSAPISQIKFDDKIHIINNALGLHTYISRVQGSKLKSKHEIRIGSQFKKAPKAFLTMIVVHELAHLKEKDHNKSFYQLCESMLTDYHQIELDLRIYLTLLELTQKC